MSQQRFASATDRSGKAPDWALKQIPNLKFWSVFLPVIFVYGFIVYVQALAETPRYHQDCAAALSSSGQNSPTQPCIYRVANASLKTAYNGRGFRDGQDAEFSFPDGSTMSMEIDRLDGKVNHFNDLTATQVNGPGWVEIWHGRITGMIRAGHRLTSVDNPEDKGNGLLGFLLLAMFVFMIATWVSLGLLLKRVKAQR